MDNFMDQFLPTNTSQEWNDAIVRIWRKGESPTQQDYDLFSRTNLIITSFGEKK